MVNTFKTPTREQFAQFLPDQETINQFEQLFQVAFDSQDFDLEQITALVVEALATANEALEKADNALAQIQDVIDKIVFVTKEDIGLAGDGVTDDAFILNQYLRTLYDNGQSAYIWLKPKEGGAFYFASGVDLKDNQTVEFANSTIDHNVIFGRFGRMRIYGAQSEEPKEDLPKIRQVCPAGSNTIFLGNEGDSQASDFEVGQRIVIRGKSDGSGIAIEKEENVITAIDLVNNNLTVENSLQYNYQPVYPASDFENNFGVVDRTFIRRLISTPITADVSHNDYTISVSSTANFSAGDYVYLFDNSLARDIGGTSNNFTRQEVSQIQEVINTTTVKLSNGAFHNFEVSKDARLIKLDMVMNSRIENARASWNTPSFDRNIHGFLTGYAGNCVVSNCTTNDTAGFGNVGNAFRNDIGFNNTFENCSAENPHAIGPGEGYGFGVYGSTSGNIINCYAKGMRHSFLSFKGAAGNQFKNVHSINARISDYDTHGANEIYNTLDGMKVVMGGDVSPDADDKNAIKLGNEFHLAGSHHNVVRNVEIDVIDEAVTTNGLDILPNSFDNIVENVTIRGCTNGIQIIDQARDGTLKAGRNRLENINIYNATDRAVKMRGNANSGTERVPSNVELINVKMYGCARHIDIEQAEKIYIKNCQIIRPADTTTYPYFVDATDVNDIVVVNNVVEGTDRAVRFSNCTRIRHLRNIYMDLVGSFTPINDAGGNIDFVGTASDGLNDIIP